MSGIRASARSLFRSPGVSAAAVIALAIGIGANTSVFSVVNAVLLRPLPYADEERVVRVYNRWEGAPRASLSAAEFFDYRDGTTNIFDALGVWAVTAMNVTGGGLPERVPAALTSHGLLEALGPRLLSGRAFTPDEDAPGGTRVAVVGEGFARRRFGDVDVVGRDVIVNGSAVTIVGVLAAEFRLPGDRGPAPAEILLPLQLDRAGSAAARGSHFLRAAARLSSSASLVSADRRLAQVAQDLVARHPDAYPAAMRFGAQVLDVREDEVGDVRPVLLLLLGAVGLVLLMTCTNVASLLLARADGRRRELAVRTALGASRSRLIGMVLAETLLLAGAAACAGVLLSAWVTRALAGLMPDAIAGTPIAVDARVLGFALAVAAAATLLSSLAPLSRLHHLGLDAQGVLRESGRGQTPGRARQRLRGALVTAQVAVAFILLAGAGLLLRTFLALLAIEPGYRVENVLTTRVSLPAARYDSDARRRDAFSMLLQQLRALPGVEAAGAVMSLPLTGSLGDLNIRIEGRTVREGESSPRNDWQVVTPGYFDAMGMTLRAGRAILYSDDERAPGVVVLNEAAARLHFPNENAIGRRFVLGGRAGPGEVTVVGIVADIRHIALDRPPRPEMYLAHRQFTMMNGGSAIGTMQLVLHTPVPPAGLTDAVRVAIRDLDPDLPAGAFLTMEQVEARSLASQRFVLVLIGAFATLAILLAAVGLYGLIAFLVGQRLHEIGVRMALGARARQILGMVLRQGMTLVGAGVVIGLAGALVLGRTLSGLLHGVRPAEAVTLALVAATLGIVGLLACLLPARRAVTASPLDALRID